MKTLSLALVLLYALLNLFLAVAGFVIEPAVPARAKVLPCVLFLLAAGLLVAGGVRSSTALVPLGLVVGSVAPVAYGHFVEHSNVLLHHLVRAVVATAIGALWLAAHRPVA